MIYSSLNKRQIRCLAALSQSDTMLHQAQEAKASWHVTSPLRGTVRLSLTGGDVWMLTKLGHLERQEETRIFKLKARKFRVIEGKGPAVAIIKTVRSTARAA